VRLAGVEAWFLPGEGSGLLAARQHGGDPRRHHAFAAHRGVVIFALELTHDVNMMLPLLVAVTIRARVLRLLVLRRSILTEKIARRGYHLSREYAIDPLEILFVREVMRTSVVALPADAAL